MHPVLNQNHYLVKEHVGMFKAAHNFDIYDPHTGEEMMRCREEKLNFLVGLIRFTDYKRHTPFNVQIRTPSGDPVIRVQRGISILRSRVDVYDEADQNIGHFQQKLLSIGGAFTVMDHTGQPLCELKGKWTSWEFRFMAGKNELALVTKKWSGFGKELFTSADNYMLQISEDVPPDHPLRELILGAVMCIDLVLKE